VKVRVYLSNNRKAKYWATTRHPQACQNLTVIIDNGQNVIGQKKSIETDQGNIPIGRLLSVIMTEWAILSNLRTNLFGKQDSNGLATKFASEMDAICTDRATDRRN
jgi:hypothetical protein